MRADVLTCFSLHLKGCADVYIRRKSANDGCASVGQLTVTLWATRVTCADRLEHPLAEQGAAKYKYKHSLRDI